MTAAAQHSHTWLILGGLGAAAAAWEWIYKPWAAAQAAAAAAGTAAPAPSILPSFAPSSMISSPLPVGPAPGGVQGSIVDPRTSPGGDVGQAMWRKGWTQTVAQARLDAIKSAYQTALGAIAKLQSSTANPAASGIPAAQLALVQSDAVGAQALANANAAKAAGNTADYNLWAAAAASHAQDSAELRARIAAASQPVDNSAAIAAYQGTIAGLKSDYLALTGATLA